MGFFFRSLLCMVYSKGWVPWDLLLVAYLNLQLNESLSYTSEKKKTFIESALRQTKDFPNQSCHNKWSVAFVWSQVNGLFRLRQSVKTSWWLDLYFLTIRVSKLRVHDVLFISNVQCHLKPRIASPWLQASIELVESSMICKLTTGEHIFCDGRKVQGIISSM